MEKRLRTLDAHSICVLSADAFFALGIADPIEWMGQASWLAEGLLRQLFIAGPDGTRTLRPSATQCLAELACNRRFDSDTACQHLLTLATIHLFLNMADEEPSKK